MYNDEQRMKDFLSESHIAIIKALPPAPGPSVATQLFGLVLTIGNAGIALWSRQPKCDEDRPTSALILPFAGR